MSSPLPATAPTIGPYSRPLALAKLDGRTREAALMRRVRAELTGHVGGNPTFPQKCLIERAAVLALRMAQIDQKIMTGEDLTTHDNNHAIAWHNAYRRVLTSLGLEPATPPDTQLNAIQIGERLEAARRARQAEGTAA
jgi:hypothetical protein